VKVSCRLCSRRSQAGPNLPVRIGPPNDMWPKVWAQGLFFVISTYKNYQNPCKSDAFIKLHFPPKFVLNMSQMTIEDWRSLRSPSQLGCGHLPSPSPQCLQFDILILVPLVPVGPSVVECVGPTRWLIWPWSLVLLVVFSLSCSNSKAAITIAIRLRFDYEDSYQNYYST